MRFFSYMLLSFTNVAPRCVGRAQRTSGQGAADCGEHPEVAGPLPAALLLARQTLVPHLRAAVYG